MKIKIKYVNGYIIKEDDYSLLVQVADSYYQTRDERWNTHMKSLLKAFGQKAECLEELMSDEEKNQLNKKGKITIDIVK